MLFLREADQEQLKAIFSFARELAALTDKLEVVLLDLQAEPALAHQYGTDGGLPVSSGRTGS